MKIISASINLNKINKSKLVKGKDGNEYLNISIICNDSENDWAIVTGKQIGRAHV